MHVCGGYVVEVHMELKCLFFKLLVCVHGGMYVHVWVNVKCMKMCVVEEDGGNESVSVCDSPLLFEHKSIKNICVWTCY